MLSSGEDDQPGSRGGHLPSDVPFSAALPYELEPGLEGRVGQIEQQDASPSSSVRRFPPPPASRAIFPLAWRSARRSRLLLAAVRPALENRGQFARQGVVRIAQRFGQPAAEASVKVGKIEDASSSDLGGMAIAGTR